MIDWMIRPPLMATSGGRTGWVCHRAVVLIGLLLGTVLVVNVKSDQPFPHTCKAHRKPAVSLQVQEVLFACQAPAPTFAHKSTCTCAL